MAEQGVRLGSRWLFISFAGMIHSVDLADAQPRFGTPWSIVTDSERRAGWRLSGAAHLAIHETSHSLYVLMHRGALETRKEAGREVWVFDASGGPRVRRIRLADSANALEVTPDDAPLLLTTNGKNTVQVYEAVSGRHLRTIRELGLTHSLIQALPVRRP